MCFFLTFLSCKKEDNTNSIISLLISKNDIPKCDDSIAINEISKRTTVIEKTDLNEIYKNIFEEKYNIPFRPTKFSGEIIGFDYHAYKDDYPINELMDKVDFIVYQFGRIKKSVDLYQQNKTDEIPNDLKEITIKYGNQINRQHIPKIADIRIGKIDEEIQSCNCTANLKYDKDEFNQPINYKIQKTTSGDNYVEIFNQK